MLHGLQRRIAVTIYMETGTPFQWTQVREMTIGLVMHRCQTLRHTIFAGYVRNRRAYDPDDTSSPPLPLNILQSHIKQVSAPDVFVTQRLLCDTVVDLFCIPARPCVWRRHGTARVTKSCS